MRTHRGTYFVLVSVRSKNTRTSPAIPNLQQPQSTVRSTRLSYLLQSPLSATLPGKNPAGKRPFVVQPVDGTAVVQHHPNKGQKSLILSEEPTLPSVNIGIPRAMALRPLFSGSPVSAVDAHDAETNLRGNTTQTD